VKRPAFMFYPADWRKDPALRVCSVAARGLWMDMLCLMHESEPYGYLVVNGEPVSDAELARLVGEPLAVVRKLLKELEARNVFSRTEKGVIYSRRFVRDEATRSARAAGGKLGGNPTLLARPKVKGKDRKKDNLRTNLRPTPSVAVAVTGSEEQEPSPQGAADSERVTTWLTPYDDAWQAQYEGPIPVEPNVSALRWLEGKYGPDETLRRWKIMLAAVRSQYASAAKLKAGWGEWASPPAIVVTRGVNTPATAQAATLWARYKAENLLTRWERPEYERIGADLVARGEYPSVDAFLAELRVTKPWTLRDARTDGYAISELANRLASSEHAGAA
jgi:hypothetical protein